MNVCFVGWFFLFACVCLGLAEGRETPHVYPDNCNVVWDTPSTNSLGSMPLGNGDIGLNVWTEPDSGALLFYISKVDAFDDRGITFKLGKVRLALTPNPFSAGRRFRQELVLRDGAIEIKTGSGAEEVSLRVWVDANQPVIRVQGESAAPMDVAVTWEGLRNPMRGFPDAGTVDGGSALPKAGTAGMKLDDQADRLVWAYRNETSVWKKKLIAQKSAALAETAHDPLLKLTSGCLVNGNGFVRDGKKDALRLKEKSRAFGLAVHVLTCQTKTASEWFSRIGAQAESADKAKAFDEHRDWWRAFWNRSYIAVEKCGSGPVRFDGYRFSGYDEPFGDYCKGLSVDSRAHAFQLTQRYALERFLQACASRGSVPPPFNGSIFTMDLPAGVHSFEKPRAKPAGANTRDWGTLPFFWQNTRHPGWSMLARGDFDTMLPSFRLIAASLEVSRDRARQWFGHEGAFMPEGILAGGIAIFDKAPAHLTYHWLGTIEMTAMMCDYFEHTQDEKFLKETLLPCADEFVKFYELHFPKRDAKGKMIMEPAGTVETYQPVTNPVTEVSGLRYLLARLLSFDEGLVGAERKAYWTRVLALLPDVPWRTVKGLELLAPGEKYAGRLICETPELYAVWPFRQTALGCDATLLARARRSFHVRQLSLDGTPDSQSWETGGWQPAPIWAACLGLPREAARLVSINFDDRFPNIADNSAMIPPVPGHPRARFPGFWETKMDYTPDNDHGAVSANALQSLLLQSDGPASQGSSGAIGGGRIYLLPAWPEDWDVSFKLHAPFNTTVECIYRDGKVLSLTVTPEARRADIVDFSSFENRIRTLVSVACADVNWLFKLPPMLDGLPTPGPTTGPWLAEYGESVKEVRGMPWNNCTFKDKTLYVFGLDGKEPVIPLVAATQLSVKRLSGKQATPVAILKLEYDRPLEEVIRALAVEGSLTEGKLASEKGIIDLEKYVTFDRIELTIENPGHRRGTPKAFAVDVRQADGEWRTVYKGNVYGTIFSKRIEPVQAQQVRLTCEAKVSRFDLFTTGSAARGRE